MSAEPSGAPAAVPDGVVPSAGLDDAAPDEGALADDELVLLGRIRQASNATFLGDVAGHRVVYKPVSGEQPLWDFPDGTLAQRERAAYVVSQALGWDVVPRTWLRDGPRGPGMVQLWCDVDESQDPVDVVPVRRVPDGYRTAFTGSDGADRPVALVHEDSAAMRRMAVFDVVVNNADRKGGHVLPVASGHRHGIDHGVTFHVDPRLRTVLWGWVGEPLTDDEADGVARVLAGLDGPLGTELLELLEDVEVLALAERCERLLRERVLPGPEGDMPPVPYPLF